MERRAGAALTFFSIHSEQELLFIAEPVLVRCLTINSRCHVTRCSPHRHADFARAA